MPTRLGVANPRIVVVGSGRSGTHSITDLLQQAGLDAVHEPEQFAVVEMVYYWVQRMWPDDDIKTVLSQIEWPEVVVHHKLTEVIPLIAELWPEVKFVWVTRNAKDTVASMIKKGWYNPDDDWWPPVYVWWWTSPEKIYQDANYAGHRTRADRLELMTQDEWEAMGQPERCCWWWAHSTRVAANYLAELPGRWWAGKLEALNVESLLEFCGVDPTNKVGAFGVTLPHSDQTEARWDPEWEPFYQRWCKDLDQTLGY